MSTLTQILLAAVMNYLGITGEVKDNKATPYSQTLIEMVLPCQDISKYCTFAEAGPCDFLNRNAEEITYKKIN